MGALTAGVLIYFGLLVHSCGVDRAINENTEAIKEQTKAIKERK